MPVWKRSGTKGEVPMRKIKFGGQEMALAFAVILLVIVFSVMNATFLTPSNFNTIGVEGAVLMIVSVGECMLVLMGNVDLSVGSTLALGAVVAASLIAFDHANPLLASLIAVGVGCLAGLINGFLVARLEWSPIVVTLGTLLGYRGVAELVTTNTPSGLGVGFDYLGTGSIVGVPVAPLIAIIVLGTGIVYLHLSAIGRHTYAVGGNRRAAYMAGINIRRLPCVWYIITGGLAAFGGLITAARLDSAPPGTLGATFELSVLTAVLLGGVAFEGGRGSLFGVVLGVAFLEILSNGLTILNVPFYYQELAQGGALALAAGLNHWGSAGSRSLFRVWGADSSRRERNMDVTKAENAPPERPEQPTVIPAVSLDGGSRGNA